MYFNKYFLILSTIATIIGFMNCGKMEAPSKTSENLNLQSASEGYSLGEDSLFWSMEPLSQLATDKPLIFFIDETQFKEPLRQVIWDHNLNEEEGFCEQQSGETPWSIVITCSEPGDLNLFFIVEYESGIDENFWASVSVLNEDEIQAPTPDEPMPDEPTPLNGQNLYTSSCAGCHGDGPASTKRNRSATQIQNAINNNVGGMGFLSSLSEAEVAAITEYLNQ